MTKVIGYARVSSREQSENTHALEQQIERLKQAGAKEVFFDVESGWKKRERPQLEKVLEMVRSQQVDEVVVTRLDRLSRKGLQSFEIFDEFLKNNVILRALDEPFDLTTAAGRAMAGQLVVFAQFHSDQKAESVKAGWKHLRGRKVAVNPPFGYIKINDHHELDHQPFLCLIDGQREMSRAAIARDIVDAFLEKKSLRMALRQINQRYGIQTFAHNNFQGKKLGGRVAHYMFRFSPCGLKNWLTNPVLRGHLPYLRRSNAPETYYNTHPDHRLITDEEFAKIESILAHNKRVKGFGSIALKYPLSGLVFCAECRSACYSLSGANNYHKAKKLGIPVEYNYYFQCKNWRLRACGQKTIIRMEKIEEKLIDTLRQRSYDLVKSKIQVTPTVVKSEILLQLEAQLEGLRALGNNPVIKEAIAKIEEQISHEKFISDSHQQYGEEIEFRKQLCLQAFSDSQFWLELQNEDKKRIYRELVDKILVRDGEVVDILLKF